MVKEIEDRYRNTHNQLNRLLQNEGECLSFLIGKFTTATAFKSRGLKARKKEALMSIEEGEIELRRRIIKHVKLYKWLKGRKEREIDRMLKRFEE